MSGGIEGGPWGERRGLVRAGRRWRGQGTTVNVILTLFQIV